MKQTIALSDKGGVCMIAHRGLSGLETENTCAAFVAAGNRSYFGIETDVHVTRDGRYILIHDERTGRVAPGTDYAVEETDYALLRSVRLADGDSGRTRGDLCLPSLSEYIRICRRYGKMAVLELKSAMRKEDIRGICEEICTEGALSDVIFISFSMENLVFLRELYPTQAAQYLCERAEDALLDTLAARKLDIDIYYEALTAERVRACHDRGIRVNCWTVDRAEAATALAGLGVDYITTNILE